MVTSNHGGDIYSYAKENNEMPLDFSVNINPLGMPKGVRKILRNSVDLFSAYPDINCTLLKAAVSGYENVPQEWLAFGNGAADLIYRLVAATRPARALLPAPTFSEYELALRHAGCEIRHHSLSPDRDFILGDDILAKIPGMDMLFLCNPNNPTGGMIDSGLLKRIAAACEAGGCTLVLDECFIDLSETPDACTFKPFLAAYPNVILLKAFTKTFAMAGLRLGYCLTANTGLLERLEAASQPWIVSVPAQLAGVEALKDTAYLERARAVIAREKTYLSNAFRKHGFHVFDTRTNYILVRTEDKTGLYDALYRKGILVRKCAGFPGLDGRYFRIAIKKHTDNAVLDGALEDLYFPGETRI